MAKEETFDIGGVKVSVSDIIDIQQVPQAGTNLLTTKGSFPFNKVPQELVDAYNAAQDPED